METFVDQTVGLSTEEEENINGREEDLFQRLPDHLIVCHIFEKISEAKCLCWCSLVSKHFSSLVFQATIVSCKLPIFLHPRNQPKENPINVPFSLPKKFLRFITTPFRFIHWILRSVRQEYLAAKDIHFTARLSSIFLRRFTSLKSLYLELDYSGITSRDGLIGKWKFDSKNQRFISLLAKGLDLAAGDDDVADEAEEMEDIVFLSAFFDTYLDEPFSWLSLLGTLVPMWSKELENVMVRDSKNQGMLVLGQKDLAEMRNPSPNDEEEKASVKFWHAPVLQLPLSGCVMKGVILCVLRLGDEVGDDSFIAEEAFQGEDNIYAEAAVEMLKKESAYLGSVTVTV